jgi:hypothetical protein
MPHIFNELPELRLVDWNTIVVYTCASAKGCYPNVNKGEHYLEEFGFIQFSDDFGRVMLGDEQEIKKQKEVKAKQLKDLEQ